MNTSLNLGISVGQNVHYTVMNKTTKEIAGTDFTLNGAFDTMLELNDIDETDDWDLFQTKAEIPVDILRSEVDNTPLQPDVQLKVVPGGKI